jgi:hypothetical protein
MTTTLIYEPIAYISDDYFLPPKAGGSASSRDHTDDQRVVETRRLALNFTDGNAIGRTASLPTANGKERNSGLEIMGSPRGVPSRLLVSTMTRSTLSGDAG